MTEPTALEVCVAHKGFAWLEIEVAGHAAHGSQPQLGVDAIAKSRARADGHRGSRPAAGRRATAHAAARHRLAARLADRGRAGAVELPGALPRPARAPHRAGRGAPSSSRSRCASWWPPPRRPTPALRAEVRTTLVRPPFEVADRRRDRPARARPRRARARPAAARDRLGRLDGLGDPRPGGHSDRDLRARRRRRARGGRVGRSGLGRALRRRAASRSRASSAPEKLRAARDRSASARRGVRLNHGSSNLERRDLLRARHGARQGVLGRLAQGRALQPAARRRRRAHPAEARLLGGRRRGAVRGDRQGLRDRARPLRDDHARRARDAGRRAHAAHRDRGVRRARRHRPDPLGVDLLPRARPGRGQAVRAAARGAREHLARRPRPRRPALEGVSRGDPAGAATR